MKRLLFVVVLLLVALLSVACDAFSPAPPADQSPPPAGPTGQSSLPVPVGNCQSRLWGKVTNAATGQSPANVAIEVVSGGKTFKTVTDPNGLYGFAGLCAGEYAMTLTPPGGKGIPNPNKVTLDGAQPIKVDLTYK
ncbi:MAG: carboxypeptidase regulatory-like domain-containing protein [Chloroflexi bacterium]|nr:carboxypeptidase regulatory-like domain-containing protein [Chloroflexota bacterium]